MLSVSMECGDWYAAGDFYYLLFISSSIYLLLEEYYVMTYFATGRVKIMKLADCKLLKKFTVVIIYLKIKLHLIILLTGNRLLKFLGWYNL